jgi:hypothetical protein
MKGVGARALVITVVTAAILGLLHALGIGLPLLLCLALVIGVVALLPWIGARWLGDLVHLFRSRLWASEQGHFHAFGGVTLVIEDDGRHVWVGGDGLQRVLGRREPDEALAARHSGHWQRTEDGSLMLRVDAVVRHLATMPGRDQPRVQRLRRYFEREVLYPADRRRERQH